MSTIQQSTLRIIEPTETVPVDHPIFLIFGQPGVCKTSLGYSAENAILLNFDTESAIARAVNRGRTINVLTIEDLRALEDASILDPFSTIVIDPVGSCVNLMSADIIDRTPKYGRDGGLTLQGFGALKSRFRIWITRLRAMNKNIMFIAHHKEDKNGDTVFVRPDITGASRDLVLQLSDFVGFLYMHGKERVLDFSPTEGWFGKNPAQWAPWRVPAPEKARTFMAQLFAEGRAALSKVSEASAAIANQVQDWYAQISTFSTLDEFNCAAEQIRKLTPPVQPQVVRMILDHAKTTGFVYDATAKVFLSPKPASETMVTL